MAKFKVGDHICNEYKPGDKMYVLKGPHGIERADSAWVLPDGKLPSFMRNSAVRSTNPVVANALAARNGFVVLRTVSGGTARVFEGDRVRFGEKEFVAKALGSPQMDKATLVDEGGNVIVVSLKDIKLRAVNVAKTKKF